MNILAVTKFGKHLHLFLEDKELIKQLDKLNPEELLEKIKIKIQNIEASQFTKV